MALSFLWHDSFEVKKTSPIILNVLIRVNEKFHGTLIPENPG